MEFFNIDKFKSKGLTLGGARSSLFTCAINFPAVGAAGGVQSGAADKFTYTCRAAELPAMTIGTVEVHILVVELKLLAIARLLIGQLQ